MNEEPEVDDEDFGVDQLGEDDDLLGALSSLKRTPASPEDFGDALEDRIRSRSAGKFFGKKSIAERLSVGVLALVIIAVGLGVYWLIRDSDTGSLKLDKGNEEPTLAPGAREAMPKPYKLP